MVKSLFFINTCFESSGSPAFSLFSLVSLLAVCSQQGKFLFVADLYSHFCCQGTNRADLRQTDLMMADVMIAARVIILLAGCSMQQLVVIRWYN